MLAYITLLSTKNYVPGVLALHECLKRTGTRYPLVTAVSAKIPLEVDLLLEKAGILVRRLPETTAIPRAMIEGNGHWGYTFDKVHLFGLHEFEKLVYVDSDMVVLANMDELFDKPHMAAVPAGKLINASWTRLNGGLMVIEPKADLVDGIFAKLPQAQKEAAAMGVKSIGDQDLINAFYPDWQQTPALQLDQGYNIFQCYLDEHINKHGYRLPHHPASQRTANGPPVKIVHFIGSRKPWMKGATLHQYWRLLKKGSAVRWEHKLYSEYKKIINESQMLTSK